MFTPLVSFTRLNMINQSGAADRLKLLFLSTDFLQLSWSCLFTNFIWQIFTKNPANSQDPDMSLEQRRCQLIRLSTTVHKSED